MTQTEIQQHTAGPWHVEKHLGRYEIWPKDHGHTHDSVATVNRDANARLIAAAPELLAAMQALFEHCAMIHNQWGEGCNREQADAAIEQGRAAITKATGGQV